MTVRELIEALEALNRPEADVFYTDDWVYSVAWTTLVTKVGVMPEHPDRVFLNDEKAKAVIP